MNRGGIAVIDHAVFRYVASRERERTIYSLPATRGSTSAMLSIDIM